MAAMSYVTLLLATLVVLTSGAKIMVDDLSLPAVVDAVKIPPQGIPKGAPNDIIVPDVVGSKLGPEYDGPIMLNDMEDIRERNKLCRMWLETYYGAPKLDVSSFLTLLLSLLTHQLCYKLIGPNIRWKI